MTQIKQESFIKKLKKTLGFSEQNNLRESIQDAIEVILASVSAYGVPWTNSSRTTLPHTD